MFHTPAFTTTTVLFLSIAAALASATEGDTGAGRRAPSGYACGLPIDPGPCDGSCPRWGFNNCTGQCEEFVYGCCGGNANNFMTQEECAAACLADPCALSIDPGPCDGSCPRWGYNNCTGQCEEFVYGCCGGNANNFMTQDECTAACPLPAEACEQPLDQGPCDGICPRWGHNPCTGQCEEFVWGCCGGNDNNFSSLAACEAACGPNSICDLPLDFGDCTGACLAWGYSACAGGCVQFLWGCCGGNANNFATLEECQGACPAAGGGCATVADCADLNGDGVRDDNCVWWSCDSGICTSVDIVFADMGGTFGDCAPDGTADANDRFHALNCFSDQNTLGSSGYPCELSPPQAMNVDAGGPFGDCAPDGVCDGNDAFHSSHAFECMGSCTCSADGPSPSRPKPAEVLARANLRVVASSPHVRAEELVEVDVFLATAVPDLRGYQLHLRADGGLRGALELVDISVNPRADHVFAGQPFWSAFNVDHAQMVAGLEAAGVEARAGSYLATFTWRATPKAAGTFVIELLHGGPVRENRTFLFPTSASEKIEIGTANQVEVRIARRRQ
jgi:hypothetical protein